MTDVFMGLTVPLAAIAIFTLVVRLSPHLRRVRDFKIDDLFIFIGFVRNFFYAFVNIGSNLRVVEKHITDPRYRFLAWCPGRCRFY